MVQHVCIVDNRTDGTLQTNQPRSSHCNCNRVLGNIIITGKSTHNLVWDRKFTLTNNRVSGNRAECFLLIVGGGYPI